MTTTQELEALLAGCSDLPWILSSKIDNTITADNGIVIMDDASYYPRVSHNFGDWKLIVLAPTIAAELIKERANSARLLAALEKFAALIKHNYSGTQEAMSDLTHAAQDADKAIKQAGETK
jgi:hypothetical protein